MTATDPDLHEMPLTRHLLTERLVLRWEATRKDAGLAIDIETCEIRSWESCNYDPYDLEESVPKDMRQFGLNYFVRSPESCGWIWSGDLPKDKQHRMFVSLQREHFTARTPYDELADRALGRSPVRSSAAK